MKHVLICLAAAAFVTACTELPQAPKPDAKSEPAVVATAAPPSQNAAPQTPPGSLPRMRWAGKPGADKWTRSSLNALQNHGAALPRTVPADIDAWCPAYRTADLAQRRAFWVGMMSALAKHESTYRPDAVGGGGKWYGLLQILPSTARGYGCKARSGAALKNGSDNLSCAIRIMAKTVPRDGVIASKSGRWRGVAADWGPMRVSKKRNDMQAWTRKQSYCRAGGAA